MASKTYLSNENEPVFICQTNGEIIINKIEHPKDNSNGLIEENRPVIDYNVQKGQRNCSRRHILQL